MSGCLFDGGSSAAGWFIFNHGRGWESSACLLAEWLDRNGMLANRSTNRRMDGWRVCSLMAECDIGWRKEQQRWMDG